MSVDMFLKIDDIKGEASDDKHRGMIDLLSWNWGVSQSGTTHEGSGGGAGKANVSDLSVLKYVDRATPVLLKLCCSGKHIKTAVLTVRKAGGKPLEYVKITMDDAIVTSISAGATQDDRITETVSLNFARVKFEYVPQKADGSGDAAIPMGWDIAANKEL